MEGEILKKLEGFLCLPLAGSLVTQWLSNEVSYSVYFKSFSVFVRFLCHEGILVTISLQNGRLYKNHNRLVNFRGKILWILFNVDQG